MGFPGCGAEGDRTPDLRTASAALSQLSYGPEKALDHEAVGFEGRGTWHECAERSSPKNTNLNQLFNWDGSFRVPVFALCFCGGLSRARLRAGIVILGRLNEEEQATDEKEAETKKTEPGWGLGLIWIEAKRGGFHGRAYWLTEPRRQALRAWPSRSGCFPAGSIGPQALLSLSARKWSPANTFALCRSRAGRRLTAIFPFVYPARGRGSPLELLFSHVRTTTKIPRH